MKQHPMLAGASAILLECVTAPVARMVSEQTDLPVISCGSGRYCDGQVMVLHDVLDLPGAGNARFAKTYGHIGEQIRQAARNYVEEIHDRRFPDEAHSYQMSPGQDKQLEKKII